ncbi:MAG: NADH-quinone oxidoreductase subunit NuoB [Nitrososphaeraceae archaeon]
MDVSDPFILVSSRSTSVPTVASSTFYSLMRLLLSIQVATTAICLYKVWTFKDIQRQEGPRYDIERFGILEAFGSLRQCDLIVVQGTVTRKMAPRLRMVYDQMPEPKYVIAMGACVITGGLHIDSYNVLPGIDGIIQVDVYVPGCPPRPRH